MTYQRVTGTLNPGAHPGSYNGQDAYNDMLVVDDGNSNGISTGQEAIVRTGHGTMDWFQNGEGVHQGCILSPCLFNLYAGYIMRNAG